MPEHPQTEREPDATPQIDTPVIDVQDLEYQPTRVNTAGLKVKPSRGEPHLSELPEVPQVQKVDAHFRQLDHQMYAREDEKARDAIAEFEESLKRLPQD